ncbi:hypothetical protein J7444_15895, partial [Labrenzia sp. R4_1]|uniref:hypothetical protein n=1 Tax=Labrenzia sp. R4_1 TaxID=2821106 RepID=UPI001AD9CD6E
SPEGAQRPTQRGSKHSNPAPENKYKNGRLLGGLLRIRAADIGQTISPPHQAGRHPTQKRKKRQSLRPKT